MHVSTVSPSHVIYLINMQQYLLAPRIRQLIVDLRSDAIDVKSDREPVRNEEDDEEEEENDYEVGFVCLLPTNGLNIFQCAGHR